MEINIQNPIPDDLNDRITQASQKYSSTLDKLIEGCSVIDFNWIYLYVNEVQGGHAHKQRSEMIGRTVFEIVPGIEKSPIFSAVERTLKERIAQKIEDKFKFADGRVGWYQVHSVPVPEGIFIQTLDVTDHKKMEEELSTSTGRFITLGDNISQLAWMADKSGWIYWYNKRWYDYTGTTFREMEGWGWKKVHHPAHLERVVNNFTESLKPASPGKIHSPSKAKMVSSGGSSPGPSL